MGLELLSQADYVLNACGRPVPPKGFKFVDLPRVVPIHVQLILGTGQSGTILEEDTDGLLFTAVAAGTIVTVNTAIVAADPPVPEYTITGSTAAGWTITFFQSSGAVKVLCSAIVTLVNATPALSALITAVIFGVDSPLDAPASTGPLKGPSISGSASQFRIENTSNTLFLCRGIMINSDPISVRIKWPTGRYWNQFPSNDPNATTGAWANFPQGTGGNLYALDEEMPIERGGKVAVELSGVYAGGADVALWGVLRYLLKDTSPLASIDGQTCIVGYPNNAKSQGVPSCLVGYPVSAAAKGKGGSFMMRDPIQELKERPRFNCWPNGNIFAPEFLLGNQCTPNTPAGFYDEAFTFLSPLYTLVGAGESYSNPVGVPGQDDVVIRHWRAISIWNSGASAIPYVGMRSPSGYSLTGGDLIPINLGYWYPVFPTLVLKHGTVLVIDLSTNQSPGISGSINVQIEFDAAKRRRIS